jgi:serine/threonine-protein kinase
VTTAFVAIAILALGGVVRAGREPSTATLAGRDVAVAFAVQPAVLIVSAQAPPAAGIVEKPATASALPTETGVAAGSTAGPVPTAPSAPASAPRKVAAAKPAKATQDKSAQLEDSQVAVSFAVFPWGDVYVDGRHLGVSPPIRNMRLPPGRHEIEFRNTTFPNHVQVVEIKPGEPVTVRHKFEGGASQ